MPGRGKNLPVFGEETVSSTIGGNNTTGIVAGFQAVSELAPVVAASKTAGFSDWGTLADRQHVVSICRLVDHTVLFEIAYSLFTGHLFGQLLCAGSNWLSNRQKEENTG